MLTDLPPELISRIVVVLDGPDFLNFRLVSRAIKNLVQHDFISEFFTTRRHLPNSHSLQNLSEVAAHPIYGPAVRTLVICPCYLRRRQLCHREARQHDATSQHLLQEQKNFRSGDMAMLWKSLNRLTNCRKVIIRDNLKRPPWGKSRLSKLECAYPADIMPIDPVGQIYMTLLVWAVLTVISLRQYQTESLEISVGDGHGQAFRPCWLRKASNSLENHPERAHQIKRLALLLVPELSEPDNPWVQDLLKFLQCLSGLRELSLAFASWDSERFTELGVALSFPYLRALELCKINCSEECVIAVLEKHRETLREVKLREIDLDGSGGAWVKVVQFIRDNLSVEALTLQECLQSTFKMPLADDKGQQQASLTARGWAALTELMEKLERWDAQFRDHHS